MSAGEGVTPGACVPGEATPNRERDIVTQIIKINATFTNAIFTTSTEAIISTISADDCYTEIARINVADLGTIAPVDHDQDSIMDGLNDKIEELAANLELTITGADGDSENFFWDVEVAS